MNKMALFFQIKRNFSIIAYFLGVFFVYYVEFLSIISLNDFRTVRAIFGKKVFYSFEKNILTFYSYLRCLT